MCSCLCIYCTVGQVVRTLPQGEPVAGVTSLDGIIFVLRWKKRDQVELYDVVTYQFQRCLTVPNSRGFGDMTSCKEYRYVYIADHDVDCIHRLGLENAATQWPVGDEPWGLSVNAAHNLLVACRVVRKIKEFSSDGNLLREIAPPDDVINFYHVIQVSDSQLIVCHGDPDDADHRLCKLSADGRHIAHSHGDQRGSATDQYDVPIHLAVDNNEFVFVADVNNRRVTLLSPTLNYIRHVVSSNQLNMDPFRLCLDIQTRRLYVAYNEWKDGEYSTGHVVVFSV